MSDGTVTSTQVRNEVTAPSSHVIKATADHRTWREGLGVILKDDRAEGPK